MTDLPELTPGDWAVLAVDTGGREPRPQTPALLAESKDRIPMS